MAVWKAYRQSASIACTVTGYPRGEPKEFVGVAPELWQAFDLLVRNRRCNAGIFGLEATARSGHGHLLGYDTHLKVHVKTTGQLRLNENILANRLLEAWGLYRNRVRARR